MAKPNSHNEETPLKQPHQEAFTSKQKQTICLQCYLTIPRRVTIIHENQIDFNENRDVFKDLFEFPPLDDWFLYEYIDAEAKKKVDKPKDNSQPMKWKMRQDITWNLSITIPTG